jgi:hypothetical protein
MIIKVKEQINKLNAIRKGEFKEGLGLGIPDIDEHFRFKPTNFNVILGHANVGKTTVILYLMLAYSKKHDLRWLIFSSENEAYSILRKMVEYLEGLPINKISEDTMLERLSWLDDHFKIIDTNELYSYKKLLDLAGQIKDAWNYDGLLIDPYNSLIKDRELLKSVGGHEYDYQATTEMRIFCKTRQVSIWLNTHASTDALRKTHNDKHEYAGHPVPPMASDVEGGGKFVNRADDFIVIHRYIQHATDWMFSMIHIRKIKDTDTGGRPTSLDHPIRMRSVPNNVGFSIEGENILHKIKEKV